MRGDARHLDVWGALWGRGPKAGLLREAVGLTDDEAEEVLRHLRTVVEDRTDDDGEDDGAAVQR